MGITSAFAISQSGLKSVEKWSEVTSANIANADRAGYAKKSIMRQTDVVGGVQISGIRRESDAALDRMHRIETARQAKQDAIASGTSLFTSELGGPDSVRQLNTRITDLESALTQLSGAPEQSARQNGVLMAAEAMSRELNAVSRALGETGKVVRQRIDASVGELNQTVSGIADLNAKIMSVEPGTQQHAMLKDEMSVLLDGLASLADTRVLFDSAGRASVYTAGGTSLVEGDFHRSVSFDPSTGALLADGIDITPGRIGSRGFSEGSVAGNITLFNETLPRMQLQLDELARGLIVGFEAADASLTPGQAGLFTDAGASFDPFALSGLASRIAVNDAVRPAAGGDLWRIRDGVAAVTEGPPGDSAQVISFVRMLESAQAFDGSAGLGVSNTLAGFAEALVSDQQNVRVKAEELSESFAASAGALALTRSSVSGVDIDDELQQLIQIEQSYAANSQVLKVLTEMLDTLLSAF